MERDILVFACITALVGFCYHNAINCGFVFDDISAVQDNKDLLPSTPLSNILFNDFWGTPMNKEKSHKSYRPLCVLTFRWNYFFHQLDPSGYHLVNVILHAVVCCCFYKLCTVFLKKTTSLVAALLFTVHPVHTEAVTGVVGRAELLSAIFFILAFMSYIKCSGYRKKTDWLWLLITLICVGCAMLCKEQGITVIGVCCIYEVFVTQKMTIQQVIQIIVNCLKCRFRIQSWLWKAAARSLTLVISTVVLLVARIYIMGAQLPVFTKFDNPASVADSPTKQLTHNYLLPVNAWLLLNPTSLCCDWTMGTIPLVTSFSDVRNLATLAFYGGLFSLSYFALRSSGYKSIAVLMSLSMLIFPFIPASNLFFPVGFVVAERILYIPSMGFSTLVAVGFEILLNKRRLQSILWLCFTFLIVSHSFKTISRNYDWKSELSLFQSALKVNQKNAKLYNNVGHALENEKKFHEALNYFLEAARIQPDDIGAHLNVGRTWNVLNDSEKAEASYRRALKLFPPVIPGQSYTARIAPNHLNVFTNLGHLIAKDSSRLSEADELYKTAISMRPDYTQAYINRGDILMRMNRSTEAEQQYHIALKYEQDNPDIYYNLGVVLLEQGLRERALKYFNLALDLDPYHRHSLFNSAILIQELGNADLRPAATNRLKQLLEFEADNEKAHFNLGMLAMDDKNFKEAEHWFISAIKLKADFRSALFNLALMLVNDLQRPLDAIPYLKQLLQFYPTHSKGLILMGDININQLKDIPAARDNFQTILKHEPHNVQAHHNLCVVYVEEGLLEKAEKCLVNTLNLAPREEYIKRHLEIVRARIQQVKDLHKQNTNNGKQKKET